MKTELFFSFRQFLINYVYDNDHLTKLFNNYASMITYNDKLLKPFLSINVQRELKHNFEITLLLHLKEIKPVVLKTFAQQISIADS